MRLNKPDGYLLQVSNTRGGPGAVVCVSDREEQMSMSPALIRQWGAHAMNRHCKSVMGSQLRYLLLLKTRKDADACWREREPQG